MNKKSWIAPLAGALSALAVLGGLVAAIVIGVKPAPVTPIVVTHPIDEKLTFKTDNDSVVQLLNDSTGKFSKAIRHEGNQAEATIVWNKGNDIGAGPVDRYITVGGKLTYFGRSFDGNKGLHYDVSYVDGVRIGVMHRFREDGSLAEEHANLAEGKRQKREFNGEGKLVKETIIAPDGSQTVKEFAPGSNEPLTVSVVPPKPSTQTFGTITRLSGKTHPVLTVEMVSDRIVSWEWFKNDGRVRQVGRFMASGKLVVSTYLENGEKLRFVETYTPLVEDWNRTFYRHESTLVFFAGTKNIDRAYYMRPNGTMEKIEDGSNNGNLNWTKFFDEKGVLVKQRSHTIKDGVASFTDKDMTESKEVGSIDATYRSSNSTSTATFRIDGEPFSGEPSTQGRIESFFVEPGKNIGDPETAPIIYTGNPGNDGGP